MWGTKPIARPREASLEAVNLPLHLPPMYAWEEDPKSLCREVVLGQEEKMREVKPKSAAQEFIERMLLTLQNKPCSTGHKHPTRLCSSCGPFPDPVSPLDDLIAEAHAAHCQSSESAALSGKEGEDEVEKSVPVIGDAAAGSVGTTGSVSGWVGALPMGAPERCPQCFSENRKHKGVKCVPWPNYWHIGARADSVERPPQSDTVSFWQAWIKDHPQKSSYYADAENVFRFAEALRDHCLSSANQKIAELDTLSKTQQDLKEFYLAKLQQAEEKIAELTRALGQALEYVPESKWKEGIEAALSSPAAATQPNWKELAQLAAKVILQHMNDEDYDMSLAGLYATLTEHELAAPATTETDKAQETNQEGQ